MKTEDMEYLENLLKNGGCAVIGQEKAIELICTVKQMKEAVLLAREVLCYYTDTPWPQKANAAIREIDKVLI